MIYKVIEAAIGHFPPENKTMLEEISTVRNIDKESIILEQGKHCNHLWFINKGAVKAFEMID
jgi:CRP-like cAMP-binding protein